MKPLFALAAVFLVTTTTAHAGDTYSFDIGGRTIVIDAPSDCRSTDCISLSIPGVYEHNPKRSKRERDRENRETKAPPQTDRIQPDRAKPVEQPTVAQPAPPVPPQAPVATTQTPAAPTTTAPVAAPNPTAPVTADVTPAPVAPKPAASSTMVANAPASDGAPKPPATAAAEASPLGIWMTEKKEGKVRIEACGSDLCGYSMDKKTAANGEKVLINMKPGDNKWAGKIYDPNSGSTYDSTIALKGNDSLRVQGCAFGGMFCGGQTWTRVN